MVIRPVRDELTHVVLPIHDGPADHVHQVWGQLNVRVDLSGVYLNVGHHFVFGLATGLPIAIDAHVSACVGLSHGVPPGTRAKAPRLVNILHAERQTSILHPNHFSEWVGAKS